MPASHHAGYVPAGLGHPLVEQFRNIKNNRRPHLRDAVALEGLWALRAAAAAGVEIDALFVCLARLRGDESRRMIGSLHAAGVGIYEVSERVLRRMADREGPDGLAALARLRQVSLTDLAVDAWTRVVIADGFELAGNLGTIIRTADGAGAAAVVVTDSRVRLTHPLVVKASMGTVFSVPVISATRLEASLWLRAAGVKIVAADPAARASYREIGYDRAIAVVLGSERYGLDNFWRDNADCLVSIPMLGTADSLNVGHAAALLLYEALHRQRRARKR
jgi:TrmH family RNA methyltransferase